MISLAIICTILAAACLWSDLKWLLPRGRRIEVVYSADESYPAPGTFEDGLVILQWDARTAQLVTPSWLNVQYLLYVDCSDAEKLAAYVGHTRRLIKSLNRPGLTKIYVRSRYTR